jgi:exonuclease V gamma subunit
MNEQNDKDLREALRRRETRRQKPQPSADFCDSVMQRIGQHDQRPKHRRLWLYPAIGAAAAIAVLLYIGVKPIDQQPDTPSLIVQTDTVQAVPQTNVETTDSVKVVKEILRMARPPKHYMAKREKQAEPVVEPEAIDAADLAQQAIAEEEQRIAMQMMQQMNTSLQDDYVKMTREIRERGNSMTQQAEMAINDDSY